jgi:hypothetical protein
MVIEREYTSTFEDHLNFQQYQLNKSVKKHPLRRSLGWLMIYFPLFFIIYSSLITYSYIVKTIGTIISVCIVVYYLLINIFYKRHNKNYFQKYYSNNTSENVTIKITENSIIDYSQYSEYKITPQWVHEYQENKDYIFLIGIYKTGIIIPKKYFSEEEIEIIKKYYMK